MKLGSEKMPLTEQQKIRYARQLISENIGEERQEKLLNSKIVQIGAGGLGSPCSMYLVAAGVGELTIIDNDTVDLSNLQRQILYTDDSIKRVKVEAAKERLESMNSDVKVIAKQVYVNDKNIDEYLKGKDYLIDCSDNAKTKFMTNDAAIRNDVKCTIAGIKDFVGQIISIDPGKSACYRCVFYDVPEEQPNIGPLPVAGVTPGVLGTMEAAEVIKSLINIGEPLYNQVLMVNLLNMSFSKINVLQSESCTCAMKK